MQILNQCVFGTFFGFNSSDDSNFGAFVVMNTSLLFCSTSFRLSFFIYAKPYASDYLLQSSGSSSEPSEQSFSWSQSHRLNMHRPLLLHLNLSSLHTTSANRKVEIEMKITVAYHCDDIINFISR